VSAGEGIQRAVSWPLYRAFVGLGVVCAVLLYGVFALTAAPIERNRAAALQRALSVVMPTARYQRVFIERSEGGFSEAEATRLSPQRVYAAYDETHRLVGFALSAKGPGYQDTIELLYGYAPAQQAVVGMVVLASRETPGLGDRIVTDGEFAQNFAQLQVRLDAQGGIEHPIEAVKAGHKTAPWQIDGLTGATVSSTAVARILRESTAYWIPRLAAQQEDFAWK
jgi:electron transport complex protein RnfG